MNVFILSPETVARRLKEVQTIPELKIHLSNPQFLQIIVYYARAKTRLEFLRKVKLKCTSLHVIGNFAFLSKQIGLHTCFRYKQRRNLRDAHSRRKGHEYHTGRLFMREKTPKHRQGNNRKKSQTASILFTCAISSNRRIHTILVAFKIQKRSYNGRRSNHFVSEVNNYLCVYCFCFRFLLFFVSGTNSKWLIRGSTPMPISSICT